MPYRYWSRSQSGQLSKNFSTKEFTCSCGLCKDQRISTELINRLQMIRDELGSPIKVTSGFRCARKQQMLRSQGAQTSVGTSTHELGEAADISAEDMEMLTKLVDKHFSSYGVSNTFIHVDLRPARANGSKRTWSYT